MVIRLRPVFIRPDSRSLTASPPDCAAALEVLHRWLDREPLAMPPDDCRPRRRAVPDCGGRFAAIGSTVAPLCVTPDAVGVPPLLTERIVAGVTGPRFAAATGPVDAAGRLAGLASRRADRCAVWLDRPPRGRAAADAGPGDRPMQPARRRRICGREFAGAGEAVAALTRRAAADAVGAGRQSGPVGAAADSGRRRSPSRPRRSRTPAPPWPTGSNRSPRPPVGPPDCSGGTCPMTPMKRE